MKRALVWAGEYSPGNSYPIPQIWVDAFQDMGYEVDTMPYPSIIALINSIPLYDAMAFIAHGASTYVYTSYGSMFKPIDVPISHKLEFVHAYTCDGGEYTMPGTWADVFTKGNTRGVFISYDRIPPPDNDFEQSMIWDWQIALIEQLKLGRSAGDSFDTALVAKPALLPYFIPKIRIPVNKAPHVDFILEIPPAKPETAFNIMSFSTPNSSNIANKRGCEHPSNFFSYS